MVRYGDGTFKIEKTGEVFKECRNEMRLKFKASNGEQTVQIVCFTKVAAKILKVKSDEFFAMNEIEQRSKIKEILYEQKILTVKKQIDDFFLLSVESVQSFQDE